jgi:hypothetical protein
LVKAERLRAETVPLLAVLDTAARGLSVEAALDAPGGRMLRCMLGG